MPLRHQEVLPKNEGRIRRRKFGSGSIDSDAVHKNTPGTFWRSLEVYKNKSGTAYPESKRSAFSQQNTFSSRLSRLSPWLMVLYSKFKHCRGAKRNQKKSALCKLRCKETSTMPLQNSHSSNGYLRPNTFADRGIETSNTVLFYRCGKLSEILRSLFNTTRVTFFSSLVACTQQIVMWLVYYSTSSMVLSFVSLHTFLRLHAVRFLSFSMLYSLTPTPVAFM